MKKFIILLLSLPLIVSCGLLDSDYEPVDENQVYFFEMEYTNFAWGYRHSGFYIDKNGEVYSYNRNYSSEVWQPNKDGYYTENELTVKYSANREKLDDISPKVVYSKAELIQYARKGSISDTTFTGADIGAFRILCYYYDPERQEYLRVLLHNSGDLTYYNTSKAGKVLTEWMERVGEKYGYEGYDFN